MGTEHDTPALQEMDTALASLPSWDPPADFAARLAAAAARQPAAAAQPKSIALYWLTIAADRAPLAAISAIFGSVLAWGVPWQAQASGEAITWSGLLALAVIGAVQTWRVLRSP